MNWTGTSLQTEDCWGCDCKATKTHLQQTFMLASMLCGAERCNLHKQGSDSKHDENNYFKLALVSSTHITLNSILQNDMVLILLAMLTTTLF